VAVSAAFPNSVYKKRHAISDVSEFYGKYAIKIKQYSRKVTEDGKQKRSSKLYRRFVLPLFDFN
jgi:hypothetical protein